MTTKTIRIPRGDSLADRVQYISLEAEAFAPSVDLLVIEHMRVYPAQKGDPNDLIDLSVLVGSLLATIRHKRCLLIAARTWKGQAPKNTHHARIEKRLGYSLANISGDARDAVGLALYGEDRHAPAGYIYNA